MSLTSAVSGIFQSIYDLFASLIATIFAIFQGAIHTVQSAIVGIVNLVHNIISQAIHLTGGVTKFVASNIVALAVGGLLMFAYFRFSASNRQVVANKKTQ